MVERHIYRITNYLEEFPDAFVASIMPPEAFARTICFLSFSASRISLRWVLSNEDIAQILIEFYNCEPTSEIHQAKEIDVEMESKLYFVMARPLPEYKQLMTDPALHRDGALKWLEAADR